MGTVNSLFPGVQLRPTRHTLKFNYYTSIGIDSFCIHLSSPPEQDKYDTQRLHNLAKMIKLSHKLLNTWTLFENVL